jgi:hypothetical protein
MQQKLLGVNSVDIDIMAQLGPLIRYNAFLQYLVGWTTEELINQIPAVSRKFCLLQNVQNENEAHPVRYSMGTKGHIPMCEAALV